MIYLHSFLVALGLVALRGAFASCSKWGLLLRCGELEPHCSGFSCCGAQAPDPQAAVVTAGGLSSYDPGAYLLQGM